MHLFCACPQEDVKLEAKSEKKSPRKNSAATAPRKKSKAAAGKSGKFEKRVSKKVKSEKGNFIKKLVSKCFARYAMPV